MDGYRHEVTSADGTRIGLLTAGDGPPLSATMPREAQAIAEADLPALAAGVSVRSCSSSARPARPGLATSPGS